jgi:tubulin-specific chaperone D
MKGSKDFTKLCAGPSILGYISSQSDGICTTAFSQLLTFLGHRYPKIAFIISCLRTQNSVQGSAQLSSNTLHSAILQIRKAAADQVYVYLVLLQNDGLITSENMDKARELLVETCWEGDVKEAAQEVRNQRDGWSPLHRSLETKKQKRTLATSTDENKSYSSLVDFSGY